MNLLKCPICGKDCKKGASFCAECGTNLMKCPTCGKEITEETEKCDGCGAVLITKKEAQAGDDDILAKLKNVTLSTIREKLTYLFNNKNRIKTIATSAVALLAIVLVVGFFNNGCLTPSGALNKYARCYINNDASNMMDLIPDECKDYLKKEYAVTESQMRELLSDRIGGYEDAKKDMTDTEKLTTKEVQSISQYIKSVGGDVVKKAYIGEFEIEYKEDGETKISEWKSWHAITVFKMDGKWYSLEAVELLEAALED